MAAPESPARPPVSACRVIIKIGQEPKNGQEPAVHEKFLAEFACVAVAVELAQFVPLTGMAVLHRPPDLVQMGVLLPLCGRRENRPQMIVAGRPVELKHRARRPGMAHKLAAAPPFIVSDALRTKDFAAPALVGFGPLR